MHGSSYRRAFGPESVVELHKNIIIQHEDYLKQDDHDKKADALRYMAGYVVQYLHLVPQEKKFTFKETERVLHNSAMNIGEFDPREGSIAFCNLAKYAENLLEQPWRKDFHIIKLTSGFYVHNIAAQLQNAHEIMIVMGYVNIDDTTLKLLPNQNYSTLKAVSRDCYVASQECLILSQIWQHVADQEPDYPLTIGEVFEYRKNHLGDTDTICNKLMYDIRARMHAVKQQQMQLHQQQNHLKNAQRFVPVDRLIDFETDDRANQDDADGLHPHHNFVPEREIERTQEQLERLNVYNDDEHIYDPVYGGDIPSVPNHSYQRKLSHPSTQQQQQKLGNNVHLPQYNMYNNNMRKSMPATSSYHQQQQQQYQQYHHNNFNSNASNMMSATVYSSDRNSVSPMIPKTVTSLFSSNQPGSRNNVSKSNSMNSINGVRGATSSSSSSSMSHNFSNQPLTRTKVKETDLDSDLMMSPRDAIAPYYNSSNNDNRNLQTRKSMPAAAVPSTNHINQNQVYPDQFYPPVIVKPVARYGSSANPPPTAAQIPYYQRSRLHSDNSEEVLNEAYAYASEVGQLPKGVVGAPSTQTLASRSGSGPSGAISQQIYQHTATPIPHIHGSDSESHSDSNKSKNTALEKELPPQQQDRILNTARSGSSTDASSSWEGSVREVDYSSRHHQQQQTVSRVQGMKSEPPKRPSHIELRSGNQIRYADSSPEAVVVQSQQSRNKNGYKELSSSSSGGSPASPSSRNYPRNEDLSSLDTVYYDYLLKQGQTDEVLGGSPAPSEKRNGKSNINNSNNNEHDTTGHHVNTHRRTGSRSSSSQHHHHNLQQNNYSGGSNEPEENHIYDGRRVVPKKYNDTLGGKKQNPVESTIPVISAHNKSDPNYNLLSSGGGEYNKPSHTKHMRKSSNNHHAPVTVIKTIEKIPDESEDPSVSRASEPVKKPVEPWDCRFCTFRNLTEERICEVCAKSKDFYEDVPVAGINVAGASGGASANRGEVKNTIQQLIDHQMPKMYSVPNAHVVSGTNNGAMAVVNAVEQEEEKECPQCTLLNSTRARICDACGFKLKPAESPKNFDDLPFDNR